MSQEYRIGSGYDIHTVVSDRPLKLAGVTVDCGFGLGGHTDGDVVFHAAIDAAFGAAGLGDIGEHFPDTDPAIGALGSAELIARALAEVRGDGWTVLNIDVTILAERPRLSAHKAAIRSALAGALAVEEQQVSVKAKTHEGHDAVGQGRAIACQAVLMLSRPQRRS